jgi:redox-sensitive bicupin YhaK (pirin superfamily)
MHSIDEKESNLDDTRAILAGQKATTGGESTTPAGENANSEGEGATPSGPPTILPVKHIVPSQSVSEGAGVIVHRAFPTGQIDYLDPFLLFDEMGPTDFKPRTARGFPDHPHKGFETVTYLLAGAMRHRDSEGNEGLLKPGDVQWMTAGRGIVHSEMPDPPFVQTGGLMHGFQLWVNLPRKDKLVAPRYQDLPAASVPTAVSEDGLVAVKIIAGKALGVVAPIETHTNIMYLHFSLKTGGRFVQPVPANFNVLAYVVKGEAQFERQGQSRDKTKINDRTAGAAKKATAGQLVIFDIAPSRSLDAAASRNSEECAVAFSASDREGLELLLIGGEPIAEPVARYGPFVMNTREEILEAVEQYQNGLLGHISNQ